MRGWLARDLASFAPIVALNTALILLTSACDPLAPSQSTVQAADRFYALIESQDYDAIVHACSTEFLRESQSVELVESLKKQRIDFGALSQRTRISASSTYYLSPDAEGRRTVLEFRCTYQHAETTETLTLDEPKGGKGPAVRGYSVRVTGSDNQHP